MPCWMSLISASSPARCSASACAARRLGGALGHLRFQAGREAQVVQRHGGLAGQHGQQVAVGVVEAAERALDVGVDEAQQPVLRHQRRHQAGALVHGGGAFGAVAQAHGARVSRASSSQGVMARSSACASSPRGSSEPAMLQPAGVSSTSSTRSAPLSSVTSSIRKSCSSAAAAQRVQAHAGVDQALERLAQAAGMARWASRCASGSRAAPTRAARPCTISRLTSTLFR